VIGGEAIGEGVIAPVHRAADDDLALVPPRIRPAELIRRMLENVGRVIIVVVAPQPAQALVKQAGIGLRVRRHAGQHAGGAEPLAGQRQPRFGHAARGGIQQSVHAPRGGRIVVPEQAVEPGAVVVGAEIGAEARVESRQLVVPEFALDPVLADQIGGGLALAAGVERVDHAVNADQRDGRVGGEPGDDFRRAGGGGDFLLGDRADVP